MTDETRRRLGVLERFACPDHGCDLEECEEVDEHGVLVSYRCPVGDHVFSSVYDPVGGYAPVDRDEATP